MAYVLQLEVANLARRYPLERLGFLTLTFAENLCSKAHAQRRFRSLRTHVIEPRYERAIAVWERQKRGAWHVHLVVVLGEDIRTGADFAAFAQGDYKSANAALRREWAFWRKTAPAYRFGRTELLPVRSCAAAVAAYVGKYIAKHVIRRKPEDRGARTVAFIGYKSGDRGASARFAWNTRGGRFWREQLAGFCRDAGIRDMDHLYKLLGPRWAYYLQGAIWAWEPKVEGENRGEVVSAARCYRPSRDPVSTDVVAFAPPFNPRPRATTSGITRAALVLMGRGATRRTSASFAPAGAVLPLPVAKERWEQGEISLDGQQGKGVVSS